MQRNSTRISVPVLILAAICCALTANSSLRADTIYSAEFANNAGIAGPTINFSGVEGAAAAASPVFNQSNVWNLVTAGLSQPGPVSAGLVNSTGANTGAQLNISHIDGAINVSSLFPGSYFHTGSDATFTISGLVPDAAFTMFFYRGR